MGEGGGAEGDAETLGRRDRVGDGQYVGGEVRVGDVGMGRGRGAVAPREDEDAGTGQPAGGRVSATSPPRPGTKIVTGGPTPTTA